MFTGIVTDIGTVSEVIKHPDHSVLIEPQRPQRGLEIGASVACDGVCLTVVEKCGGGDWFKVTVSQETLERTAIGHWKPGSRVNLERSLRIGDELGGHIVSGHVDGVTEVESMEPEGSSRRMTLRAPKQLARYLAEKGSVALNGVSLTVNRVTGTDFTVNLIPHTLSATTWGSAAPGDLANVEIDVLARYISRFQEVSGQA